MFFFFFFWGGGRVVFYVGFCGVQGVWGCFVLYRFRDRGSARFGVQLLTGTVATWVVL